MCCGLFILVFSFTIFRKPFPTGMETVQVTWSFLVLDFIFLLPKILMIFVSSAPTLSPSAVTVSSTSRHGDPDPNNSTVPSQPEQRCSKCSDVTTVGR